MAKLDGMDWDHLRTFEAAARLGSLTAAAKALGISQSTVSRQLKQLESRAGSPLLLRELPLSLTARGADLFAAVSPMIEAALAAEAALDDRPELRGMVSITTVGELLRWVIVPALPDFYATYPGIALRVLTDNRVNSLAAGEADIALRFVRPQRGDLVARKIHTEHYGLFAASDVKLDGAAPWLGLAGSLGQIAEQQYADRIFADRAPRLLVEDVESLGAAVQRGLGVAVLPRGYAQRLGVVEVEPGVVGLAEAAAVPSRALWLVVHGAKARVPRVRAVMDWAAEVFGRLPAGTVTTDPRSGGPAETPRR